MAVFFFAVLIGLVLTVSLVFAGVAALLAVLILAVIGGAIYQAYARARWVRQILTSRRSS